MFAGDHVTGFASLDRSEALLREHGWRKELLQTLMSRVRAERRVGAPDRAAERMEDARALCAELDLPPGANVAKELERLGEA